ncbi:rRNA-processing protein FCF2-like protein [Tanacetum coccineum]
MGTTTMLEVKKRIGLSWEPQVSSLLFGTKSVSNDKSKDVSESSLVYKPNSELIDGLFVPPNDPKKVNKILKKQVKDTAGKSWFDMPAPTLTPELKKDLQLLKVLLLILILERYVSDSILMP